MLGGGCRAARAVLSLLAWLVCWTHRRGPVDLSREPARNGVWGASGDLELVCNEAVLCRGGGGGRGGAGIHM